MTRRKISSVRREELIQATLAAVCAHGFADLTVARIAEDAQVSAGNIHYYFGGKEALLEATMRHLLELLKAAHGRQLADAATDRERLHAVVQANFDEEFLTLETCRVWTQFWAHAPYRPKLARLHNINRARVRSNIVFAIRTLVPVQDVRVKTNAIQGYMDGVWVQVAQSPESLNLPELQVEARRFIEQTIGAADTHR